MAPVVSLRATSPMNPRCVARVHADVCVGGAAFHALGQSWAAGETPIAVATAPWAQGRWRMEHDVSRFAADEAGAGVACSQGGRTGLNPCGPTHSARHHPARHHSALLGGARGAVARSAPTWHRAPTWHHASASLERYARCGRHPTRSRRAHTMGARSTPVAASSPSPVAARGTPHRPGTGRWSGDTPIFSAAHVPPMWRPDAARWPPGPARRGFSLPERALRGMFLARKDRALRT